MAIRIGESRATILGGLLISRRVFRTSDEHTDAAIELVSLDDLTPAGACALLHYLATVEAKDPDAWPETSTTMTAKGALGISS